MSFSACGKAFELSDTARRGGLRQSLSGAFHLASARSMNLLS
jgi:hypothetical protein